VKLLVYGSVDFGRVLRDVLGACGHEFAGYIDDVRAGEAEVLGAFEAVRERCPPREFGVVIAVGYKDLAARWRVYQRTRMAGYECPALIHPAAYVRDAAAIGPAAVVMARAIVDMRARINDASVLWPGANVSHDAAIGANTFLSPNATICGFVTVGRDCFIGAGAVVPDHRTVPDGSYLKAGAVYGQTA
jgi:sugar O-acyltransferase (sialic acid O-acetyltransferase NeuD family)